MSIGKVLSSVYNAMGRVFSGTSGQRSSHIGQVVSKILVVSGAGGNTANTAILKFINAGYKVIALTGSKGKEHLNDSVLQYLRVERSLLHDLQYLSRAVRQGMDQLGAKYCDQLVGLNLIGGSIAPSEDELRRMNLVIPMNFFNAISSVGRDLSGKTSLVQISSVAATINGDKSCHYARLKKEADELLLEISLNGDGRSVALRPGIVLPEASMDGVVNMGHDYSPEQFANWPIIPIVGSGNQLQQPISEQCLYQAALNSVESVDSEGIIIDAVGSTIMTQKQLFTFFNPKARCFLHIPIELAMEIAQRCPLGRLAPYSVRMFATLDADKTKNQAINSEPFIKLLEKVPKSIHEIYSYNQLVGRESPLPKHIKMIYNYTKSLDVVGQLQFFGKMINHGSRATISTVKVEDKMVS